jgi:thioredoxin-related protein
MRFLLFTFLIFSLNSLFGSSIKDINWEYSYEDALKEAKKQNKYVMVLITSKRCKWCKKLKYRTLSNAKVINTLNDKFISVEITRNVDDYPKRELRARAVPTTYFLTPNGKKIMKRPVIGYWNVTNYLSHLNVVDRFIKKIEGEK